MEIVYSCVNGGDYTKEKIEEEIWSWMAYKPSFNAMPTEKKRKAVSIIYPILLSMLDWEGPFTKLDQWDDNDGEAILKLMGEQFNF